MSKINFAWAPGLGRRERGPWRFLVRLFSEFVRNLAREMGVVRERERETVCGAGWLRLEGGGSFVRSFLLGVFPHRPQTDNQEWVLEGSREREGEGVGEERVGGFHGGGGAHIHSLTKRRRE